MSSKYNSIICNLNTSMYKNICVSYNAHFLDQTDSSSITTGGTIIKGGLGIAKNLNIGKELIVLSNSTILSNMNITNNLNVSQNINIGTLQLSGATITDTSGTISFGNENLTTTGNVNINSIINKELLTINNTEGGLMDIAYPIYINNQATWGAGNIGGGVGIKFHLYNIEETGYRWGSIVGVSESNYSEKIGLAFYTNTDISTPPVETMRITNNGAIQLLNGMITSGGNSIDFGTENVNTTGTLGAGVATLASSSTIGNLTLANGSITDSSGTITFGDENLNTTGTLGAGIATLASNSTIGNLTLGNGSITDSSGTITFGNENLTTTGTLGSGIATLASNSTIGNLTLGNGSITDSSGTITFGNENLNTTGNIGIGTANPSYQLDIYKAGDSFQINQQLITDNDGTGSANLAFNVSSLQIPETSVPKGSFGYIRNSSQGRGDFIWCNDANADTNAVAVSDEVMRLDSAGKLTINNVIGDLTGIADKAIQLSMVSSGIDIDAEIPYAVIKDIDYNVMAGKSTFNFNGVSDILSVPNIVVNGNISSTGNLNINTGNIGNIVFSLGDNITSTSGVIDFQSTDFSTTGALEVGSGNITGNVGIGTANPSYQLDIYKSTGNFEINQQLINDNGGTGSANLAFNVSSLVATETSVPKASFGYIRNASQGRGDFIWCNDANADTNAVSVSDEVMRLTNNGKLGIGNSTPLSVLDLGTSVSSQKLALYNNNWNTAGGAGFYGFGTGASRVDFHANTAEGGTPQMVLKNSGYLGIGITNPSYRLHLSSDSAAKPSTNTWTISSDIRIKQNITTITKDELFNISKNFEPKRYNFKDDYRKAHNIKDKSFVGIIADEVKEYMPCCIDKNDVKFKIGEDEEGNDINEEIKDCYNYNGCELQFILFGCIPHLIKENEEQQTSINDLLTRIEALENL